MNDEREDSDRWISVREASARLGWSPSRVRTAIRDGTLRAEKVGGRWHVDPSTVRAVVEGRRRRRFDGVHRVGRERTRWRQERPDPPGRGG